jgi:sec-independent protein translocase protein TatC
VTTPPGLPVQPPLPPTADSGDGHGPEHDGEMSFIEHLEELRWHLFRSVSAIAIAATAAFLAKRVVFDYLIFSPKSENFPTYRFLCWLSESLTLGQRLCLQPQPFEIINLEVTGQFLTHIKVSMVLGLIVAFPVVLWEIWRFIKPGLYDKEARSTRGFVIITSLLFFIGVSFGYFGIIPFSINFLVGYSVSGTVVDTINLGSYIGYLTMIVLACGLIFELPVIVYFLARIGLIGPEFMKTYRKHAFVIILITSAIITPPDVTSQLLIAGPVYLLYELSIRIAARVEKRLKEKDEAESLA